MARYTITKTWVAGETLRAEDLAVEGRAIAASANSVVDIDAAQTQLNIGTLPRAKLARSGSALLTTLRMRGSVDFGANVSSIRLDRAMIHQASRVIGVSFGAVHPTSAPVAVDSFPALPDGVTVNYMLLGNDVTDGALDTIDAERSILVAAVDHVDLRGLVAGDARTVPPVVTRVGARTILTLWADKAGAPDPAAMNIGLHVCIVTAPDHLTA